MTVSAFPLAWPPHFARTKWREPGRFKTALPAAIKNVQASLRNFASDSGKKLENLVVSSNVSLGTDRPTDPGVAVWFVWDGLQVCIPVDRYNTVAGNLQAIHHIIEARRVELRHGSMALVKATFTGFAALPAPAAAPDWQLVLELTDLVLPNRDDIEKAYRRLASKHHPDRGGDAARMAAINKAREQALAWLETRK